MPVLLSLLLAAAAPQPCVPDRVGSARSIDAEAFIRRAEEEWAASIKTDQAAFLERYAAPGFVAVFDGEVLPRATLIASARKRRPGTASIALKPFRVHVAGPTAIAEGTEMFSSSTATPSRIIWSDLWVRCGLGWRLLTSTSATLPLAATDALSATKRKRWHSERISARGAA